MPDPPASLPREDGLGGATPGDPNKFPEPSGGGDDQECESKAFMDRVTCHGCEFQLPITPNMNAQMCFQQLDVHIKFRHPEVANPPPHPPAPSPDTLSLVQYMESSKALLKSLSDKQTDVARVQSARLEPAERPRCEEGMSQSD